jgi:uncharacterized protein
MKPSQQVIDSLLEQIVAMAHPLRVVLFGSAARGQWTETSDIDLLIVVPDGCPMRKTAQHLYATIRGIRIPYDLVVATPAVLSKHADDCGMVYRHALREGRELYAA